jgi:hypothetical protein
MNKCHHVSDDSDINDASLKAFIQGNLSLKLYCVCTESHINLRNLSHSRNYEYEGKYNYMTCSEKTPIVQFILSQLNAGHELNMVVELVTFLIRIWEVTGSDLVTGHAQV